VDIQIRFIGIPNDPRERQAVERRVSFALDRIAPAIRRVTVALRDENGPRGGVDQRCTMHLVLRSGGRPIVVRSVDESVGKSVTTALERARRRLERRLPSDGRSAA